MNESESLIQLMNELGAHPCGGRIEFEGDQPDLVIATIDDDDDDDHYDWFMAEQEKEATAAFDAYLIGAL